MVNVLETGDIFFFYQGARHAPRPQKVEDIEHFYIVLSPTNEGRLHRLIEVARPSLPTRQGRSGVLAYVEITSQWLDTVHDRLELGVEARARRRPAPMPAGEGRYALVEHHGLAHLAYQLELPDELGAVQQQLGILRQGNYHVEVLSTRAPSPLGIASRPTFPRDLLERFDQQLTIPAIDSRFLDFKGCELALLDAAEPGPPQGVRITVEEEQQTTAEIFRRLGLEPGRHPTSPLVRGDWAP